MRGFLMILTFVNSTDMINGSTPELPFLTGIAVLTSLYFIWYRGVHPLVST